MLSESSLYPSMSGEKTVFLSHLYIKVIFLPRQARDKHRENSKTDRFLAENSKNGGNQLLLSQKRSAAYLLRIIFA
jgi:hypothetical protein